jgi:excisionase family DNA binding protein
MPRVNFKSYQNSEPSGMPSELQLIVSTYGPYLTIKDAAQCLRRTYGTVYGLVRAGELKAARTGRKGEYIIPANEIVCYVRKNMPLEHL